MKSYLEFQITWNQRFGISYAVLFRDGPLSHVDVVHADNHVAVHTVSGAVQKVKFGTKISKIRSCKGVTMQ